MVSDTDTHVVQANLESGRAFGPVAWGVNYFQSEEDRADAEDFEEERYDYNLAYRVNAQFSLIAEGGKEDNDFRRLARCRRMVVIGALESIGHPIVMFPSRRWMATRFQSGAVDPDTQPADLGVCILSGFGRSG